MGGARGRRARRLVTSHELLRASSSASLWVKVVEFEETEACVRALRARGYACVGTALHEGASIDLHAGDGDEEGAPLLQPRLALWVGSEGRGLSPRALSAMDALVHVRMAGMVESLNVAACAAVALAEVTRRRRASGDNFAVSGDEADSVLRHLNAAVRGAAELGPNVNETWRGALLAAPADR